MGYNPNHFTFYRQIDCSQMIPYYDSMIRSLLSFTVIILVLLLSSCILFRIPAYEAHFMFEDSIQGWTADYSDYPVGPDTYEFAFTHTTLPENLGDRKGLYISSSNHSDDLFTFIKKKLTGLEPNTTYSVEFRVKIASKYPAESLGIGGSPGSSVFLKAGASLIEPVPVITDGYCRMNIDKGNQKETGVNAISLGTIGKEGSDNTLYEYITRTNACGRSPFTVTSDAEGDFWVFIGTDSGFEGITSIYYDEVEIACYRE